MEDRRLDRIEQKIDKLSEVVISMAHVEEKIVSLEEHQDLMLEKIYDADQRYHAVERRIDSNEVTIQVINRIFWIAVTALTGAYLVQNFVS
jgi:hypothetical protein